MADYAYLVSSGVIVPDTGDLLTTVQDDFKTAFGQDLVVTPDTPQGVLITAETLARDAVIRNNAALANQINPNQAGGVFLDAIWALTGGQRVRSTPSLIATVTVAGTPGATIPAGSQASVGAAGAVFESVGAVQLDGTGTGVIAFQSIDLGPVAAPAHGLDTIVSGVLGWETVDNTVAATLGLAEESDQASRARRRNTLALQGVSLPEAILSVLNETAGVKSAIVRENFTGVPVVIDGVNLVAHSIFACVAGGTDDDVGAALLSKKSFGCNWNGTTIVNVLNPVSGQIYPVEFQRPTDVPLYMSVTVKAGSSVPDPAQAVRQAILDYASGDITGEVGFAVGRDVSPFELASAINAEFVDLFVTDFQIGIAPGVLSAATIHITISQLASIIAGNIAVIVG